jgi:acyl carrier protein
VLTISDSSHLLSDLGLTSLDFADIAIGLETGLGIGEFPIEDWLAAEGRRVDEYALTVGSLVDTCVAMATGTIIQRTGRGSQESSEPTSTSRASTRLVWIALAVALSVAVGIVLVAC